MGRKPAVRKAPKPTPEPYVEPPTEDYGPLKEVALAGPPQDPSFAISLQKAEIDQAIATARAYPRNIDKAVRGIVRLVKRDKETAIECIYELPRAGKKLRGPSIRFAEIVFANWGNCRAAARILHTDRIERWVEAEAVFHDLETGAQTLNRVRRSIKDREGRLYSEDMQIVTGNAACAIAKRNAIFAGIPRAIWREAYDAVEEVIRGDERPLSERRDLAIKSFAAYGVSPARICAALDVRSVSEIGDDELFTLTGMRTSIKTGEATADELFPEPVKEAKGPKPKNVDERLDEIAGKGSPPAPVESAGGDAPSSPVEDTLFPPERGL